MFTNYLDLSKLKREFYKGASQCKFKSIKIKYMKYKNFIKNYFN